MRARLHLIEEDVVLEIRQRLAYAKIRVWRVRERLPVTRNGVKRFEGAPSEAGLPDLIGHVPHEITSTGILMNKARPVYIEVKRPKGKRRLMQEIFIREAQRDGAIALFAESWKDVCLGFAAHGITLPA